VEFVGAAAANRARDWLAARLSPAELAALARQGSVSLDRPARGRPRAKLRFRYQGKQRVVYIGVNAALAAEIAAELRRRQQKTQGLRGVRAAARQCRQWRREYRREVARLLGECGYYFHGYELRLRRSRHTICQNGGKTNE
jgi:hypothetical protein